METGSNEQFCRQQSILCHPQVVLDHNNGSKRMDCSLNPEESCVFDYAYELQNRNIELDYNHGRR